MAWELGAHHERPYVECITFRQPLVRDRWTFGTLRTIRPDVGLAFESCHPPESHGQDDRSFRLTADSTPFSVRPVRV